MIDCVAISVSLIVPVYSAPFVIVAGVCACSVVVIKTNNRVICFKIFFIGILVFIMILIL
ncbi:hypothetical protein D3C84_1168590 [compost metagenome]